MKSQTHAPSSAACNQCCLLQAWCPRGLGWQVPFGWRTPQQVTLVPVSVACAKRPVVVERLAAQRQQLKASRHQGGSSSSSKSGRGSGCSGRKGLTPILFMLQGSTRSCLVYPLVCVLSWVRASLLAWNLTSARRVSHAVPIGNASECFSALLSTIQSSAETCLSFSSCL